MAKELKVSEIIDEFNLSFNKITKKDIETSGLYDNEIKLEYKKRLPNMIKFLKSKDSINDKLAIKNNKEHVLKECVDVVYEKYKNLPNTEERKEVFNILSKVSDKYDMGDARVYIIIKQLVDMILSVHRIQKESIILPPLIERMNNETGESSYYNNPLLKLKLDYNMSIVKLISDLNKIIEGEKVTNLNLNANVGVLDINNMIREELEDIETNENENEINKQY